MAAVRSTSCPASTATQTHACVVVGWMPHFMMVVVVARLGLPGLTDTHHVRRTPERMSRMETVERKKPPRPRRSSTPEFKAAVVELVRQPGKTVGRVARESDLTETAARAWVKQADIDEGRGLTA